MKVSNTNLNRLTRWESFQFLADVINVAESHEEGKPELFTNKLAELQTAFNAFDEALVQEKKASPQGLLDAEEARDYAVRKIYAIVREYADFRFDETKESAGKVLLELFEPYGTGYAIAAMRQDTETAVLVNLIQDLRGQVASESIEELGLTNALDNLAAANHSFERKQLDRRKDNAEFVAGVVKTTRVDAQSEMIAFADVVNALAIVEGEEKYTKLKQTVNSILSEYVAKAKQRSKTKEEDTPEEVTQ